MKTKKTLIDKNLDDGTEIISEREEQWELQYWNKTTKEWSAYRNFEGTKEEALKEVENENKKKLGNGYDKLIGKHRLVKLVIISCCTRIVMGDK